MKINLERIKGFRIFPRKFFIYAPKYLAYIDISRSLGFIVLFMLVLTFMVGYFAGGLTTSKHIKYVEIPTEILVESKHDYAVGDIKWKDSVFLEYSRRAELYLTQEEFAGTPLNGDILSLAARNAYDSTGVLLPLELALSQAQWESNMGRSGRSPERNPYNVGEYDNGTVLYFESTFDGVQAYYYLMCINYLSCRSLNELFINFINCEGNRYASKPSYERSIKYKYYHIQQWIDENIETEKKKQQLQKYKKPLI
jgi:hypothetical protein